MNSHSEQLFTRLQKLLRPSPLQRIEHPLLCLREIDLLIKRDDLLHPIISGNKWRKLKYVIKHVLNTQADTIISMGGAYSNHLHALAYVGQCLQIKTIGMIRGERPQQYNTTLMDLSNWGMQLNFVPRSEFRQLREFREHDALPDIAPGQYWLPEGGALPLAFQGVGEILQEIDLAYEYLCVPCGTGTTLAGLLNVIDSETKIVGFAALKGGAFLYNDVRSLLTASGMTAAQLASIDFDIRLDYHFGGFAKHTTQLLDFMLQFRKQSGVTLDSVYTAKMLYGIFALVEQGYFIPGSRIIALHTGGLQGDRELKVNYATRT